MKFIWKDPSFGFGFLFMSAYSRNGINNLSKGIQNDQCISRSEFLIALEAINQQALTAANNEYEMPRQRKAL